MDYVLILGAKSDIAKEVAHGFAKIGYNIYLAARKHEELEDDVKDLMIRYKIEAKAVEFDALHFESHKMFYSSLEKKPVGVVCAVGYMGDQINCKNDFIEIRKIFDTNFTGCISIINIICNDFEERQKGFIIGISSVAGDRGRKSIYFYGSAKAAFTTYLSGMRNMLSKSNVKVITVKPGFVRTSMTEGMKLPELLTASPEKAAKDIISGWKKRKDVIYTKWFWRYIMLVIRIIPERFFKRCRCDCIV